MAGLVTRLEDIVRPYEVTDDVLRLKLTNAVKQQKDAGGARNVRKPNPTIQQITHTLPEDYAKLKYHGEYFWVMVDQVNPDTRNEFVGIVYDDLTFSKIYRGDEVYFRAFDIFDLRSQEWKNHDHI